MTFVTFDISFKSLIIFLILLFDRACVYSQQVNFNELERDYGAKISLKFTRHDFSAYNAVVSQLVIPLDAAPDTIDFEKGAWRLTSDIKPGERTNEMQLTFNLRLVKGESPQTKITLEFLFDDWNVGNYVLMPASVYNGNRFGYRSMPYPPKLFDTRDLGPNVPMLISDIPKLNITEGYSAIYETSGALSVPAIGFANTSTKQGFWLQTRQGNKLGDYGIGIEESIDRRTAKIVLSSPVVKELFRYDHSKGMRGKIQSAAPNLKTGDEVEIRCMIQSVVTEGIQDLFDHAFEERNNPMNPRSLSNQIPFSAAFQILEEKWNNENWLDAFEYYKGGGGRDELKSGWGGGMITTFPFLLKGNEQTRSRAMKTINRFFPSGVSPYGFIYDVFSEGAWRGYTGDYAPWARKEFTKDWHLIRRSGDILYFSMKQLALLKHTKQNIPLEMQNGIKGIADAFVKLWKENKQLGQFVNLQTGKIEIGNSTSGAIAPAGLTLASIYFNDKEYLNVAIEIGDYYYSNFITKGITSGGPGDALQNPDSESSYAMVESMIVLHNYTREQKWLERAIEMAHQFSTWVLAYDYKFPEGSLFQKLDMRSTGAVYANGQNKHGAPGICNHSGIGLLKLFRATGDEKYARLLQDITHNHTQYMSRADRPINGMNPGWINERVQMTDWEDKLPPGEIFNGSTWSETALMLVCTEIPGLYIVPDRDLCVAFDNVELVDVKSKGNRLMVTVKNTTSFPANITVYMENSDAMQKPLSELYLLNAETVKLQPGESKTIIYAK